MKLIFVVDTDWFFLSHRLPLALAAKDGGYEVLIVSADTGRADVIRSYGLGFRAARLIRHKLNPLNELRIIKDLFMLYRQEKPDIVHHVSLKIIINGSVAARLAGVRFVINAVTGLGHYFINRKKALLVNTVFSPVFRLVKTAKGVRYIFQNEDDRAVFAAKGWIRAEQAVIIKGAGIDLRDFPYTPEPATCPVRIFCGTRLLWDKGIREFIDSARAIKLKYGPEVEFILSGKIITENPTGIHESQVREWVAEGVITYLGFREDIYSCLANSHINVLPSYREGLPKSVIEACAVGRPVVTTDVPGCREVVKDGLNGFLVPARDAEKLTEALMKLIDNKELRIRMGLKSRKIAVAEFDVRQVVEAMLRLYCSLG